MAKPIKHRDGWRVRWTDESGKRLSETHPTYEMAELMQTRHELHVREVKLSLKTGYCPTKNFAELSEFWLTTCAPNKRSFRDDKSIIKAHLMPEFGTMPLKMIKQQHVEKFRLSRSHLSPKTIQNHIILFKTMLNRAYDMGWLETPPRIKVPRVPNDKEAYSYLRSEEEIRRFLVAALEEGEDVFRLYKSAIYTGMRAGELAGLMWSDIDFKNRIITIQRSYSGPTKNYRIRRVPIFDSLLPDLKKWALVRLSKNFIFPNTYGRMLQPSSRIFQEKLHKVLQRADFPKVIRGKKEANYIRFHDLRHTFASHFVMNGGDIYKLQKILGHQSISMTERYSHLAPHAFEKEFDRFGSHADFSESPVLLLNEKRNPF